MSADTDEAYLLGRQANLKGEGLETNPFEVGSTEHKYWHDGYVTEEEHTRLLGIHFSAKKGLEEKVEEQEETIQTKTALLSKKEGQLRLAIERVDRMEEFISGLRDIPPRWAKSYRKQISNFCDNLDI